VFQFDGYNYHFQMDYPLAWARAVEAYRAVCDACPDIKVSLEFKPTDAEARFSIVGSTGDAIRMAQVSQEEALPCGAAGGAPPVGQPGWTCGHTRPPALCSP
jgi:hypothetical protein